MKSIFHLLIILGSYELVRGVPFCNPLFGFTPNLHRLGDSRFYILYDKNKTEAYNWTGADEQCQLKNLQLATIDHITTMAVVSRLLEKKVTELGQIDPWYWLNARFNTSSESYVWQHTKKQAKFNTYFYRQPRPIGVGGHVAWHGGYFPGDNVPQCLTLALPYLNGSQTDKKGAVYGYAASFDERACEQQPIKHRYPLCEFYLPQCRRNNTDPYIMNDQNPVTKSYFDDGNWIIGDRKYILSWGQRTHKESEMYCKSLGLQIFNPSRRENCLIPYIKMWARNVTASQYWTGWKYSNQGKLFRNAKGQTVAYTKFQEKWNENEIGGRSSKGESTFCVAVSHWYEFKTQMNCSQAQINAGTCSWSFLNYLPANCNNRHGVICQHKNAESRACLWKKEYITNISMALEETAVTQDFGWAQNKKFKRSKYKQTFGSLICPSGHRMVRQGDSSWLDAPLASDGPSEEYRYDYLETYWVVDGQGFNKTNSSQCTISAPVVATSGKTRIVKLVSCTEWNFYLCKRESFAIVNPGTAYEGTNWEWGNKPTHRQYPATNGFSRPKAQKIWMNSADL